MAAVIDYQTVLNRSVGLVLNGVTPDLNHDRIQGILNLISWKEQFDDIKYMLDEPIVNFTQSVVDDSIKKNAEFQYQSGLSPKIKRTSKGKCCKWCDRLVGTYEYAAVRNTGNDVFRRHKYCRCTVEFITNGKRQNVHTKKWKNNNINIDKKMNKVYTKVSGAITDIYSERAEKHAIMYYEEIRHKKSDVARIAKNTGYEEKFILDVKEYLFIDEHKLPDGIRRFDPDFMIAQSWQRLEQGNILKHDLTLLKHEELERSLMKKGLSQNDAHIEATRKYDYAGEAEKYYGNLKKNKKSE